jgi:hypothetical protein
MPRLKFVATAVTRGNGYQYNLSSSTAQYLESNSVAIFPKGTLTQIVDNVSGTQYDCSQTYTVVITRLDTASASPSNQVDLS